MKFQNIILIIILFSGCQNDAQNPLFVLRKDTAIQFENNLVYTEEYNPYTYRNFYNGGGVALGDINNDGLIDVYFTGNLVSNKLYLNKGNWEFEDITDTAGVACENVWSTGANFVDVNADGLLDLYVCKAGKPGGVNRFNELFINQGNLSFEEHAQEYGLDVEGLSIQSAFLDFDRDGDLDCYLLNNSIKSIGAFDLESGKRNEQSEDGNKFFENQNGKFVDISSTAGIYTSEIGFGLGITISDFNLDLWPDLYISNDFFEKDYLYINNQDGTFTESSEEYFACLPLGAMGADAADLNNDLYADLMITEMLPSTLERKKTKAVYENWKKYNLAKNRGYHRQMPRNMLQRNFGDKGFLEVGRKANVDATDWSWSSLIQDFDNDGLKDIFVSNGIYKDLLDRDYLNFIANDTYIQNHIIKNKASITALIDSMPSQAIPNCIFKNEGDFNFQNNNKAWGLDDPSFSNGCAYADLDNDGDLDLVVNNVNMQSFVYENTSEKIEHNYISISLKSQTNNTKAIGAKIIAHACKQSFMIEQFPSRGFQSSVSNKLFIGLGSCELVDSLHIIWPDGNISKINEIEINSELSFTENPKKQRADITKPKKFRDYFVLQDSLDYSNITQSFNQFNRERLLHRMNTVANPIVAISNDDKNVFVGGAKNQESALFQLKGEYYQKKDNPVFENTRSEVVNAEFFDSDDDGDLDLYVAHGGTAFAPNAAALIDELFINDGNGVYTKKDFDTGLSISSDALAIGDYNGDGLQDIFIGDRKTNFSYGTRGSAYLYKNIGNNEFELLDIEAFNDLGIITDADWVDINQDSLLDLIVVGEWMDIQIFINDGKTFQNRTKQYGFENTKGIWIKLLVQDFNGDGYEDIFVGNLGENNGLHTDCVMYINDFDSNGSQEQVLCQKIEGKYYPVLDMDELFSQIPKLKKNGIRYQEYASKTFEDLFGKKIFDESALLSIDHLDSKLFIRQKDKFVGINMPNEVQYSSVHAAASQDFNGDGEIDLVIGGNDDLVKPQFGADDASKAWILFGSNHSEYGFQFDEIHNLNFTGNIRDMKVLDEERLIVAKQNQKVKIFSFEN